MWVSLKCTITLSCSSCCDTLKHGLPYFRTLSLSWKMYVAWYRWGCRSSPSPIQRRGCMRRSSPWTMVSHAVWFCLMVSHDVLWCLMVCCGVSWSRGVLWCLMVCCVVMSCGVSWSRGVLWCLMVYCVVMSCGVSWSHGVLWCVMVSWCVVMSCGVSWCLMVSYEGKIEKKWKADSHKSRAPLSYLPGRWLLGYCYRRPPTLCRE